MAGIAISGNSGCGATTASAAACEATKAKKWNFTLRDLALERKTTLEQMQKDALLDAEIDYEIDRRQARFCVENEKFVVASRLAIWLDDARILSKLGIAQKPDIRLKVWLEAPVKVRAERIAGREEKGFDEVLAATKRRDAENAARYRRLYGIDTTALPKDAVRIDSEKLSAQQVAERITRLSMERKLA